ncbi:mitogen-activated protein kinase-binding protein 1-like [Saccostrea echinata]|uniref:mitogen-activated protein kinase-binding protein 1-like n=1 Tax=Saccostrea echinata TaxID=191078 RepID=UPI002A83DF2A|nr:mitogen-activated protein kinase-binding protein 1-like [Saccostrea echinata]
MEKKSSKRCDRSTGNVYSFTVNSMAFSKDGSVFVTVRHRHVKFWYLKDTKLKINQAVPLQGSSGILRSHLNNFYCDVSCGHTVYAITQSGLLCQLNEKRELDKFVEVQATAAYCISAGKDHIFVGCADGVIRIFDANLQYVATMPHPHWLGVDVALHPSHSHLNFQTEDARFPDTVAISYDDVHRMVTCVYNDHSLYVWDVHDVMKISKICSFLYHSSGIWGSEVNPGITEDVKPVLPSGSFITCSSDDTIRIWNLDPHMMETESSKRNVYSNELLKIVYVDPTHTFLKDVSRKPADEGKSGIRCIGISPDGRHLASGDRIGNIRVHNLRNMEEIIKLEAHDQEILCVHYSNLTAGPKLMASGSRDRLIHVFDVDQSYNLMQTLADHSSSVTPIKFTENDEQIKMLSSSADKSVLFREAHKSSECQFEISKQQHVVGTNTLYDIDIEPTQKHMATACQDRNIRVYNIETVKQMQCYKGAVGIKGVLLKLQLDPSGQYVVTCCSDKSLCLLDFKSGEILATMIGHSEQINGVKFMPDLKRLVSVSSDGCIFVWRLSPELTESMRGRLEEMGRLPYEAINAEINRNHGSCWNRTYRIADPAPLSLEKALEEAVLSPGVQVAKPKVQEEVQTEENKDSPSIQTDIQADRKEELPDYNSTITGLPDWIQAKMGRDISSSRESDNQLQPPSGRWAVKNDSLKSWKSGIKGPCVEGEPQGYDSE